MTNSKAFAEIIQSSLHTFLAQSWEWGRVPEFGSLVTITTPKRTIFALVHQIQTGSSDPIRQPFPYKKTHEELLKEQPQIFEFLKTTFSCLALGYKQKGKIYYLLPSEPSQIHSFVEPAPADLQKEFFVNHHYLHLLFALSNNVFNLDELLLALLKQHATLGILSEQQVTAFVDTFSLLTGNDYRRLKLFLSRAQQLM